MRIAVGSQQAERRVHLDWLVETKHRIVGRLKQGSHSENVRYGLRRDLTQAIDRPSAKIPIDVRAMVPADLDFLLPADRGSSLSERLDIAWRRGFYRKAPHGCHVAVDLRDNRPCYMQWLISSHEANLVRGLGLPKLADDEALLENAYTPPSHRGLGIMSAAMAMIAEQASKTNARYVTTFVGIENTASLKGCQRAGFHPHLLHRRVQYGFGTFVRHIFVPLAQEDSLRTIRF